MGQIQDSIDQAIGTIAWTSRYGKATKAMNKIADIEEQREQREKDEKKRTHMLNTLTEDLDKQKGVPNPKNDESQYKKYKERVDKNKEETKESDDIKRKAMNSTLNKQHEVNENKRDIDRQKFAMSESSVFPIPPGMSHKQAFSAWANMIYPRSSYDFYNKEDVRNAGSLYQYLKDRPEEELINLESLMHEYNPSITLDLNDMLPTDDSVETQVPSYLPGGEDSRKLIQALKNRKYQVDINKAMNDNYPTNKAASKEDDNGRKE